MRKPVVTSRVISAYHGALASETMEWLLKTWAAVPIDDKARSTLVVRALSDGVMIGFEWRKPQLAIASSE